MSEFHSDPGYRPALRRIVTGGVTHPWVAAGVLTIAAGVLVMLRLPESRTGIIQTANRI